MKLIDDKIQALIDFKESINSVVSVTLNEVEQIIADLNTESQLYEQGVNADNIRIDSYKPYTARTIQIKQSKGQPTDRVTLRDTGAFHMSFRVEVYDNRFEIIATDEKINKLVEKYGKNIIGLTNENLNYIVWNFIYDALIRRRDELL